MQLGLTLLTALLGALTVLVTTSRLRPVPRSDAAQALAGYFHLDAPRMDTPAPRRPGSGVHIERDTYLLQSLGLPNHPRLMLLLQIGGAALPGLLLYLVGMPGVLALGASGLGFALTDSYLTGKWRTFCSEIERELPTFVSRLAGMLQVTDSTTRALDEVVCTLGKQSPLQHWMQELLLGIRYEGEDFIETARTSASHISPSLGLVVFLLGRMSETGGTGFADAFTTVADELSAVLEARAIAGSKADAARHAVQMLLVIMGAILFLMFSNPQMREGFAEPTVQMICLAALGAMAYGYLFLQGMIHDALE